MKITRQHFALFCNECRKWYKIFQLEPYHMVFHFGLKRDKYANCYLDTSYDNNSADIYFDKKYKPRFDLIQDIKDSAKHEMIHLLLNKLSVLGKWRWTSEQEYDHAEEELVRKLVNLINSNKSYGPKNPAAVRSLSTPHRRRGRPKNNRRANRLPSRV